MSLCATPPSSRPPPARNFLAGFERFGSSVRSAADIMFGFQRRTPRARTVLGCGAVAPACGLVFFLWEIVFPDSQAWFFLRSEFVLFVSSMTCCLCHLLSLLSPFSPAVDLFCCSGLGILISASGMAPQIFLHGYAVPVPTATKNFSLLAAVLYLPRMGANSLVLRFALARRPHVTPTRLVTPPKGDAYTHHDVSLDVFPRSHSHL